MDNNSAPLDTNKNTPYAIQPITSTKSKLPIFLLVGFITLSVAATGVAGYYLGVKGQKISLTTKEDKVRENTPTSQPQGEATPTTKNLKTPLFSGNLRKLDQNLDIFKLTEADKLNGVQDSSVYYEAGKFNSGQLKDYTRIVAIRPPEGPGNALVFILATKDFQKYLLDDPEDKTNNYPQDNWQNPYLFLDKSKIQSTRTFDTELSKEIVLDQNFSLYQEEYPTENVLTNKKDNLGNKIYEYLLLTNFSSYQKLSSPFDNLTFYFKPYEVNAAYLAQINQKEKQKEEIRQKFFVGDTEVIVTDSVGLPTAYSLTTPDNIRSYREGTAKYETAVKKYDEDLKTYLEKKTGQYPVAPEYVPLPNLGFKSSKITQSNNDFFKDYETAFVGACAFRFNSKVINVSDGDLEKIGSVFNQPLNRLKNMSHSLLTLAYNNKMDYYDEDPQLFSQVNKSIKKLTLEEYISKNPLLFIKDYWKRWVALGEFDIKIPGGCGKPVIYLYPEKPTEVTVKFQTPVEFTTDIPKYADFWKVEAYPDGSLVNLKPELTDCPKIDSQKAGSEYALGACLKNTYPYLYWAGNIISKDYPVTDRGWIVEKSNLNTFFDSKLTRIGLNSQEKNDFTSYWLPEMISKDAPYYRITFLQTNDLNEIFPMTVNPKPDTVFRLFLDYLPLTNKPAIQPAPQVLETLNRSGFTLVEWGGLKRP